jgi:predicted hotdog family 3-hydroxylacyl-ACP dehydratase
LHLGHFEQPACFGHFSAASSRGKWSSMIPFPLPIEHLLPQRPPLLLLDRLLSCTASEGTADALISSGNLFRLPDGTIHAAAFFELMAQSYAAVNGYQNQLAGKPVSIGYLAGITRAVVHGAARVGDRLLVTVRQTARVPPFVRAEARVVRESETLAEGVLTLFIPPAAEQSS